MLALAPYCFNSLGSHGHMTKTGCQGNMIASLESLGLAWKIPPRAFASLATNVRWKPVCSLNIPAWSFHPLVCLEDGIEQTVLASTLQLPHKDSDAALGAGLWATNTLTLMRLNREKRLICGDQDGETRLILSPLKTGLQDGRSEIVFYLREFDKCCRRNEDLNPVFCLHWDVHKAASLCPDIGPGLGAGILASRSYDIRARFSLAFFYDVRTQPLETCTFHLQAILNMF